MRSAKGDENAVGRAPASEPDRRSGAPSLLRQQSGPSLKRYAEAKLAARLERISSALRRAAKDPEGPENIHDLRVAIRRFTQALRVFKDLLDGARVRKMRRRLKKIMNLCGEVRNHDIALEALHAAGAPVAQALERRLRKTRSRIASDLSNHLSASRAAKIKEWRDWLRAKAGRGQTIASTARRVLVPLTAQFFKARAAVAKLESTAEEMHRFRLTAKRLRYTLEIFGPVAGPRWKQRIEQIRGLQEHLGEVNDCVVTGDLIGQPNAALDRLLRRRVEAFHKHLSRHFLPGVEQAWLAEFRKIE
jgi:CHAD domain-containing protein